MVEEQLAVQARERVGASAVPGNSAALTARLAEAAAQLELLAEPEFVRIPGAGPEGLPGLLYDDNELVQVGPP